jgi:hypothetical protein
MKLVASRPLFGLAGKGSDAPLNMSPRPIRCDATGSPSFRIGQATFSLTLQQTSGLMGLGCFICLLTVVWDRPASRSRRETRLDRLCRGPGRFFVQAQFSIETFDLAIIFWPIAGDLVGSDAHLGLAEARRWLPTGVSFLLTALGNGTVGVGIADTFTLPPPV